MLRRPPRSTRTETLLPDTRLVLARVRAGADGSGRGHLHAAVARLRDLPGDGRLPRARTRRYRTAAGQAREEGEAAAPWRRAPDRTRRGHLARPAARPEHARRAARAARRPWASDAGGPPTCRERAR